MEKNIKKFLRLHNASNNSVVIVSLDVIDIIDTDTTPDGRIVSTLYTNSDIKEFSVNETPEKIYTMIEELNKQ